MPKQKAGGRRYLVVRHTSIPRTPGGDPNDSIELEPGTEVTPDDVPSRLNTYRHVERGAWIVKE